MMNLYNFLNLKKWGQGLCVFSIMLPSHWVLVNIWMGLLSGLRMEGVMRDLPSHCPEEEMADA